MHHPPKAFICLRWSIYLLYPLCVWYIRYLYLYYNIFMMSFVYRLHWTAVLHARLSSLYFPAWGFVFVVLVVLWICFEWIIEQQKSAVFGQICLIRPQVPLHIYWMVICCKIVSYLICSTYETAPISMKTNIICLQPFSVRKRVITVLGRTTKIYKYSKVKF